MLAGRLGGKKMFVSGPSMSHARDNKLVIVCELVKTFRCRTVLTGRHVVLSRMSAPESSMPNCKHTPIAVKSLACHITPAMPYAITRSVIDIADVGSSRCSSLWTVHCDCLAIRITY
jgi:hypothetical protein